MKILADEKMTEQAIKSRFTVCQCGEVGVVEEGDGVGRGEGEAREEERRREKKRSVSINLVYRSTAQNNVKIKPTSDTTNHFAEEEKMMRREKD